MNTLLETSEQKEPQSLPRKISPVGKIFVAITGGVAIGLTVICAPFISPAFRKYCLPYIPATDNQVKNILAALKGRRGTLLDLGSGDGRIVLETAKNKFISHGVELNPWLVIFSKICALREGITNAKFYRRDLWKYSIHQYDNIVIFGVEQMMNDLEKKFIKECNSNCKIIACRFPLPNLTPIKTIGYGIDTVWVYSLK
ncbi:unnamed protein product [Diabrotica balteata]|uniref:Uncharacterized protein n=1 Tax=Diabrotica balteata TaxID=107213 RepID=A0A9N9SWR9_DIABA|nr:unnamed protein product [Diabrotica balteata]CAG9830983.1 unnamed protein product [Diabrotica balteata]